MTREETIKWLESLKAEIGKSEHRTLWHYAEAIDMAIEALTEPKTIIGIDIPYGSDKGIATIFKGNEKMVLEEVKEIMSVVKCKDCKHYIVEGITTQYGWCHEYKHSVNEDDYCSYGEREK